MDRNRNIPIDKLFADLKHYEATEVSGGTTSAWEQMKHLLDQKLPEGQYLSSKRPFRKRYLLPLLLLLTGAATYLLINNNSFKTSTGSFDDQNIGLAQAGNSKSAPSGNSRSTTMAEDTDPETVEKDSENNPVSVAKPTSQEEIAGKQALTYLEKAQNKDNSRSDLLASTEDNEISADPTYGSDFLPSETATKRSPDHKPRLPKSAGTSLAGQTGKTEPVHRGRENNPEENESLDQKTLAGETSFQEGTDPEAEETVVREKVVEQIFPEKNKSSNLASKGHGTDMPLSESEEWIPVETTERTEEVVRNEKEGGYYTVDRDTFKRIEKQVTTLKDPDNPEQRKFKIDTLSIARIEKVTYRPVSYQPAMFIERDYNATFASNSKYALENKAELVPLSSYKVASKKIKPSAFASLKRTANGLESLFNGEKDWYMAIFAGGHSSLGNPGSLGMQAGVAALYTFRERWIISAEARFMRTYFPGYRLLDEFSNFEVNKSPVPGGGWLFSGTEQVTTNEYILEQVSSIHMPITLSYNFGRLSAFGGVDLSYSFPLKWKKESNISTLPVSMLRPDEQNPFTDGSTTINEKEAFRSRIGLGYVAGLSYDFSRKLSLDIRMRQTLLDNAHYNIPELKKIYRRPSVELSLGFYFGRREKVIYIMDTH